MFRMLPSLSVIIQIVLVIIIAVAVAYLILEIIRSIRRRLGENESLKYEFITIIAHKFRTPLTQAKWLTEGLLASETDPYKKESLTSIQVANQKLIDLTGTLVELTDADNTSKTSYVFETSSVCDLARSVAEGLRPAFHEKNIFFSVECPPNDVMSSMDRARMEFVLQTLFENALNYSPPGRDVRVQVGESGKKVFISVADNGIGIRAADIPHLFMKFYRTANAKAADTEGFGVGLYLAQTIVRRHSGKIDVTSPGENQGSTFTITLPKAKNVVQKITN